MKLAYKLFIPIAIFVVVISSWGVYYAEDSLRNSLLEDQFLEITEHINKASPRYLTSVTLADPFSDIGKLMLENFSDDIRLSSFARITVWNRDRKVIYSDLGSIIGTIAFLNPELNQRLISPGSFYKVKESDNNIPRQSNIGSFLDIFVPIKSGDQIAAVVEVHAATAAILYSVNQLGQQIILTVFLGVIVILTMIYLLIGIFVGRPINKLKEANMKVMDGNFNVNIESKTHDEFKTLNESFNSMVKGLKRLEELENEFVFVAAHELRAPVTALSGYLELFGANAGKSLDEESSQYYKNMIEINQRFKQLVNDLLEVARSDAGKIEIKVAPVDISSVIQTVVSEMLPLAKQKQIDLSEDLKGHVVNVFADENKLKEIFVNLVSNAIKYTRPNGYVAITHEIKDMEMVINVEDNGLGISADEQSKLFDKFFRSADRAVREEGGTGLGLFIVKQLVEKQGGKIWFKSEYGKGSVFSFSLKRALV